MPNIQTTARISRYSVAIIWSWQRLHCFHSAKVSPGAHVKLQLVSMEDAASKRNKTCSYIHFRPGFAICMVFVKQNLRWLNWARNQGEITSNNFHWLSLSQAPASGERFVESLVVDLRITKHFWKIWKGTVHPWELWQRPWKTFCHAVAIPYCAPGGVHQRIFGPLALIPEFAQLWRHQAQVNLSAFALCHALPFCGTFGCQNCSSICSICLLILIACCMMATSRCAWA